MPCVTAKCGPRSRQSSCPVRPPPPFSSEPSAVLSVAAEWARAIHDLDAIYVRDISRPGTAYEVPATFEFGVKPDPSMFFADGASVLTSAWSLVLEPDVRPVIEDFSLTTGPLLDLHRRCLVPTFALIVEHKRRVERSVIRSGSIVATSSRKRRRPRTRPHRALWSGSREAPERSVDLIDPARSSVREGVRVRDIGLHVEDGRAVEEVHVCYDDRARGRVY